MERQKRALAVHDISCIGKCSLTAALPIISVSGVETAVLPTAVLSTHTGGFEAFTYRDLTNDLLPIVKHWQSLDLSFDAIYTGFLGSVRQVDIIIEILNIFGSDCLKIVDPAMADDGKMYTTFDLTYAKEMKKLCTKADILVPNVTEACIFLEKEYTPPPYSKSFIEGLLEGLLKLFGADIVLTGVCFDNESLGAATIGRTSGEISYCFTKRIPQSYPGSGDVFASVLTAALLRGFGLCESAQIAAEFTAKAVEHTFSAGTDPRFGLNFEAWLGWLAQRLDS